MNCFPYLGIFADRDNCKEAYDYAVEAINSIQDGGDRMLAMTALHVVTNTVQKQVIEKGIIPDLEKKSCKCKK